jgi:DNA-directed RNA polymerase subunit N (RpoN/RPB10)
MKDLKYICNTYQSFKELIEKEDDPKQLLETLKSKRIKYIFVPLEYHFIH